MPFGNDRQVHKVQNFKGTIAKLIKFFKPQAAQFIIVVIILVASATLAVVTPLILKDLLKDTDKLISPIGTYPDLIVTVLWTELFSKFGLMLGLYVASAFLNWLASWIIAKISADYAYKMRKDVKDKLDRLPLSYYDSNTVGEILSRGTNDIENVSRNMSSIVNQTVLSISLFIGVVIAMFVSSWQLALVAIATLPLTIGIVLIITVQSQKQFKIFRKKYGDLNSVIEETYSGVKIVKLFNKEESTFNKFSSINGDMMASDRMSQWLSGFIFPSMRFVQNLGFVGVCLVSGLISNNAPDTIATMVSFFLFLQMFQQPFQQLGQIMGTIQSVIASAERTFGLLEEKEFEPDAVDCIKTEDNIQGKIDIENVSFSYSKDKELITNLNLHVNPGDSIAIVGPTGAGKTTIVNLLMRFYEVDGGVIKLDDIDIKNYSRATLRGSVGMVLQDTWLFNGTIKENIRYGRNDATDQEIEEAARQAHAYHFIKTLPGGFDFELNEDGTNISQGQRQLLTIARAIVSKPKIMILDEATSSVDTRTEVRIQDAMNKMMVGRTSFIIAHRLSTIKNAKVILVMQKGHIVEMGNHAELLALNGFYAELYNTQFLGKSSLEPVESES